MSEPIRNAGGRAQSEPTLPGRTVEEPGDAAAAATASSSSPTRSHDAAADAANPAQKRAQSADQIHMQTEVAKARPSTARNPGLERKSLSYAQRPTAEAYYDSRAATHAEWERRAVTLEDYYRNNPRLLPQLPFTWHHGWKRWRLFFLFFVALFDASAIPIALYYGMHYGGHVEGYIIFAVITTIWGGPTYLEFAIRTLRLMKKEKFYRPLGTESRWCFDLLNWASSLTIFVVTALFIIGSAPHLVWLPVLCMPPAGILYCLGGVLLLITVYSEMRWPAPFRISSTAKGEQVHAGVYYFIEDAIAVNAGAGRPYREALAARYRASPRFRRMLRVQTWFWAVPSLLLAVPLTVIPVVPTIPTTIAYGVCWAVPFIWFIIWGFITARWCKKEMVKERLEWEADNKLASPRAESMT